MYILLEESEIPVEKFVIKPGHLFAAAEPVEEAGKRKAADGVDDDMLLGG